MTANTATKKTVTEFACRCSLVKLADGTGTGCTAQTVSKFKPGHDAKLKSLLGQAQADGTMVSVITNPETGETVEVSPLEAAGMFGNFGYMVVQIAEKIQAKRDRASAHKAKLAVNKAAREAAKSAKKAKVEKEPATAKVGRWEREGFLVTQKTGEKVFEFAQKDGSIKQVTKFELV